MLSGLDLLFGFRGSRVELMSVLDLLFGFGGSRGGGLFSGLDLYGTGMHRVVVWT